MSSTQRIAQIKANFGIIDEYVPVAKNEALEAYWKNLKEYEARHELDKEIPSAELIKNVLLSQLNQILAPQGKEFIVDDQNEGFFKFMCLYLAKDVRIKDYLKGANHKVLNTFSFEKGICVCGTYGLGKSLILRAASLLSVTGNSFGFTTTNTMVNEYQIQGPKYMKEFFTKNRCIDDFGTEQKAFHYGKQVNIFKTILEERYNSFINKQTKTHISTNLTLEKIEDEYGSRVESRLHEMCNIVIMSGNDRRKM